MTVRSIIVGLMALGLGACGQPDAPSQANQNGHTAPSAHTISINQKAAQVLKHLDPMDFTEAQKGFIARPNRLDILGPDGVSIYDQNAWDFIQGEAPDSVNPSLWRQEKLNNHYGLYKVRDSIYQLRGFDIANMTLIKGELGWVVVDPLGSKESARAAMAFAEQHLGKINISAIIFTHSHIDHFAGVQGITSVQEVKTKQIPIIAPQGFVEASTQENVMAGIAMRRRTDFAYGQLLAKDERGHVGLGLGKQNALGSLGIIPPTITVDHTHQSMQLDGIDFIFQYTPESEAPAELTFYLPQFKAFCGAELVSRNQHNVYTLRGAKVRDALAWSGFIDEALQIFGEADTFFASHHWPIWGQTRIHEFLKGQRDTYKYIHDQTLRMANAGLTPLEIADELTLPDSLANQAANRGYYGTVSHNSRAVYQAYFGWFDGNPANLNPLPPVQSGEHYVQALGGDENVMKLAQQAYDDGEYRWGATLLNHLVFAQPGHQGARNLLAKNYDQLGYQAESGPWRGIYLTGALELRHGYQIKETDLSTAKDLILHTPLSSLLNALEVNLNGPKAQGVSLNVQINFTDIQQKYDLWLENSVLHHTLLDKDSEAVTSNAQLDISYDLFINVILGKAKLKDLLFGDELSVSGSTLDLLRFFALLDKPSADFAIVEP